MSIYQTKMCVDARLMSGHSKDGTRPLHKPVLMKAAAMVGVGVCVGPEVVAGVDWPSFVKAASVGGANKGGAAGVGAFAAITMGLLLLRFVCRGVRSLKPVRYLRKALPCHLHVLVRNRNNVPPKPIIQAMGAFSVDSEEPCRLSMPAVQEPLHEHRDPSTFPKWH